MLPHAVLRPSPMGLVPALVSPRMSCMLDNLLIQTFIAILLLPPAVLAALAAGRIRSNVTEGARAGRVDTLAIWRR
jgi:hypothetical protein